MILIAGLGNPGAEYDNTRHNVGFKVIDNISKEYNIEINRQKFKGVCGEGFIANQKVMLLKPSTYMNLSGESIREAMAFYKLTEEDIIVVYDDISLPVGRMRIRDKGSAGGHNGIKSIIQNIGTEVFPRVKIGVGQPEHDLVSHVLGKFSKEDSEVLQKVMPAVEEAVETIIKVDSKEAMNRYNGFNAIQQQ